MDRLPDLSDLDNWLDNCAMAEYCVRAGSERTSTPAAFGKDRQEQKGGKVIKPKVFINSAPGGAVTDKKCAQCEKPHLTRECRQFRESSVESRAQVVKDKKLCFKCLEPGHAISGCKSDKRCGQDGCKSGHHRLMHNAPRVFPSAMKKEKSEEHGEDKAVKWSDSKPPFNGMNVLPVKQKLTLLPIVPVIIRSPDNKTIQTYALLDCASEITLLREDARKSLSLSGPEQLVEIGTWHSQDPKFKSCMVSFTVESVDGLSKFEITDAYSVPRLNLSKRPVPFDKVVQKWPHLAVVPLSCVNAGEVKLLIGMDHSDPHDI